MEIFYWELWSSQSHWVNQLFQMLPTCIQILLHWFFLSVWRFSAKQQEALKQFHHQSLNLEYCCTTRVCITIVHVLYFYVFVLMHMQNIFLSSTLSASLQSFLGAKVWSWFWRKGCCHSWSAKESWAAYVVLEL